MARGWESKSVEEGRDLRAEQPQVAGQGLTAEQQAAQRHRESLELSRERVLREWNESSHPRRRAQLAEALAYLEAQLSLLCPPGAES